VAEHSIKSDHRIEFHETEALAKTSGYMYRFVEGATETKLHPDNINREEKFKLSKAWNTSTGLLRHSNTHSSLKSQGTEKSMQERNKNVRQQGHKVKQHGERLESDG
jgi:hypothetical protein